MNKFATIIDNGYRDSGRTSSDANAASCQSTLKVLAKKTATWLTLVALTFVFGIAVAANDSHAGSTANLNQCVDKALSGKGKRLKHVKIKGHHFHCYPAKAIRPKNKPGVVRIVGRLDHDIKNMWGSRPDDEVYYGFEVKKGRLVGGIETKIIRGGFAKTLSKQLSKRLKQTPDWRAQLANKLAGKRIKGSTESLIRGMGSMFTGKGWDKAAKVILHRIAKKAAKRYR